jgi:hypothetical protein
LRHDNPVSTAIDRRSGELSLLLQEGKEAMQAVQDIIERGGSQTVVMGGVEPGIDIFRRGLASSLDTAGLDRPQAGGRRRI